MNIHITGDFCDPEVTKVYGKKFPFLSSASYSPSVHQRISKSPGSEGTLDLTVT